ncbi:MAG: hypothetical protein F6K25_10045 [Okeania sp. SIO2G4]|uniref:hypothetical protein n=1 Tax=unclassified Okeania TaxID=2634635 RepID=UPI0013B8AB83|nr:MULTISPECIES: hypothetical protein [unclassified Okeania]NEP72348.1 hypothetical protein [Okeania sp. SIO2G5]NEP94318.1 hypothetical protein [Okeania sp. SIO2F5]NEQ91031.1 hypothetical protein [Okeania sp. SIO2G4]
MNASSQAITLELASKIAHLGVLFRAEFPGSTIDLSPWLTDEETQSQLDPHSIDLNIYCPKYVKMLACQCFLVQVYFSENLLLSTCQLRSVYACGYMFTDQQWEFSTEDWTFIGLSTPQIEHQVKFKILINRIFELFKHPNQVNISE